MFHSVEPNFRLHPEHVSALQAVDLRLAFVFHGHTLAGWIMKTVGVCDDDYSGASTFVEPFQPDQDVFACEDSGGVGGEYAATQFFASIAQATSFDHLRLNSQDRINLEQGGMILPDPNSIDNQKLTATWNTLAKNHITHPIQHAIGRAGLKGVRLWSADATQNQEQQFMKEWLGPFTGHLPEKALVRYFGGPELRFRNNRTLEQLGMAALTMNKNKTRKPILGYMGGAAHQQDIEAKLNAHGIPFTATELSPDWRERKQVRLTSDKS